MAKLKVTQVKSTIKKTENQKLNLLALGLKKINQSVEIEDKPELIGMVRKVKHLVKIENI